MTGMYDVGLVEDTLPYVWDEDRYLGPSDPHAADDDMPRGSIDPSHAGNGVVHILDVRTAWDRAPLTLAQRRLLFAYYRAGMSIAQAAQAAHVSHRLAEPLMRQGLQAMTDYLNGGA